MRGVKGTYKGISPRPGGYFWFNGQGIIRKVLSVKNGWVRFEERKRLKTRTSGIGTTVENFERSCSGEATVEDWRSDYGRNTGP